MSPPSFTPASWLERLERLLAAQQKQIELPLAYYDGDHRMAFQTAKFRETFGALFRTLADNWCQIVVDAPVERLRVQGFRFGENTSDAAWGIWQDNNLDAGSKMAHTEAVKCGRAFALVAPPARDGGSPLVTVEHPSQVVVCHAPGNRRSRLAALKKWVDEDGYAYATLYLPNSVVKFRSKELVRDAGSRSQWVRRPDDPGGVNPLGVVPMIPLENNPGMLNGGRSDLDVAIPLQDAINKEIADMLIASEFAAFPQRVLTGVSVPTDPATGQPVSGVELKAAMSRLWTFENPDAKFGEFKAADLANYVAAIEMMISHLAAQTRTPPHYLLGKVVNVSGDALKAAETGLVAKVRGKQTDFADPWEETMRLALASVGKADQARATDAETIWADPEYRAEGELVDAAVKLRTLGVPLEKIWERVGYSPQEIDDMKTMAGLPDRPPPGATTAAVSSGSPVAEPAPTS